MIARLAPVMVLFPGCVFPLAADEVNRLLECGSLSANRRDKSNANAKQLAKMYAARIMMLGLIVPDDCGLCDARWSEPRAPMQAEES